MRISSSKQRIFRRFRADAEDDLSQEGMKRGEEWRSGRDSNPRPPA